MDYQLSNSSSDEEFWDLANSSSDEELLNSQIRALQEEKGRRRRRGSITGRLYKDRERLQGHQRLFKDYFSENPIHGEDIFRRRFRMHRALFLRIVDGVTDHDSYFVQKRDGASRLGLSSLQKCTAAMRMLAYGVGADVVDDYIRIGESTAIEALRRFVQAVIDVFGAQYLRRPTAEDICILLSIGESRGFRGMLGSIDCMHWKWKNCPVAWKGMFSRGDHCEPSLILEAVAAKDLWIWHSFFGLPGSHNDINVLEHSPLFADLREGRAPPVNFRVNDHDYKMGYYLADGIYPSWSTFVKTIPCPQGEKAKNFAKAQEGCRKDVERAFGVLQAHFAIVKGPARFWDRETLQKIMKACVIMHNMIIEDERAERIAANDHEILARQYVEPDEQFEDLLVSRNHTIDFEEFISNHLAIRDRGTHSMLQADLVEHLWQLHVARTNT
ncbi:PREDICTED: uncharacterized protein LOC101292908 [Fragaria vesca subsp. vesca]